MIPEKVWLIGMIAIVVVVFVFPLFRSDRQAAEKKRTNGSSDGALILGSNTADGGGPRKSNANTDHGSDGGDGGGGDGGGD